MKVIFRGEKIQIDKEDAWLLFEYSWYFDKSSGQLKYDYRKDGKRKLFALARLILGVKRKNERVVFLNNIHDYRKESLSTKGAWIINGGILNIPLGKGRYAITDVDEYDKVSKYNWCLGGKYVHAKDGNGWIYLHHLIMENKGRKIQVDHINGDNLDNRKINLRYATNAQNQYNQASRKNIKYKGTTKCGDKWASRITKDYKAYHLGVHSTQEEAARQYNVAAEKFFGEYSRLNIIEE